MVEVAGRAESAEGADEATRNALNRLTEKVIGVAIKVHKKLGPGFMERLYEQALAHELSKEGLSVSRQKTLPVHYEGVALGNQRVDLLVGDEVIVEVKAVSEMTTLHEAQLLSYLRATDKRVGLILNFAKERLEIKRKVNRF